MKIPWFRYQFMGLLVLFAFSARYGAAQASNVQPLHYAVTDLGQISPANPGPLVISNQGIIAETVTVANAMHAALSFQGATLVDLTQNGDLGGPNTAAFGVNRRGQATGEAETADSNAEDFCGFGTQQVCEPFLWQDGVMSPLPLLQDMNGVAGLNAAGKSINNRGEVGGVAENTTVDATCPAYDPALLQFQIYQQIPVIWAQGAIRALPTAGTNAAGGVFNDPDGVVFRINNRGQAVGATGVCTGFSGFSYVSGTHATLWWHGTVTDLGNLGGVATPPPGSGLGNFGNFAYNINRRGHVVGVSGTSNGTAHAFFWTPAGHMQDVGTIPADGITPADVASIGLAISDEDEVGGVSFPANALPRAFIRPSGGTPLDLNSLVTENSTGLYLITACSINSRGEVVGLALDAAGNLHGYLAVEITQ